jgi:hypothetical protein
MMKMMMRTLLTVIIVVVGTHPTLADTLKVDCDKFGRTITKALRAARPGDTIRISGVCEETVTITTDRVTLDGGGSAILQGAGGGQAGQVSQGLLNIVGAQGVDIRGFTVRDSPVDGISVRQGAAVTLHSIKVEGSADDGIEVTETSSAQMADCTTRRNGEFGIDIIRNSNAIFNGTMVSNDNGIPGVIGTGLLVEGASSATFRSGNVQASDNGLDGILVSHSATASMTALGPTLTVENNGRDGLVLFNGASLFASSGTINAVGNGRDGVRLAETTAFSVFPPTTVSLTNNAATGLSLFSARALIFPALLVENNTLAGISLVDSSATLFALNAQHNGPPDIALGFAARALIVVHDPATVTVTCDGTAVLSGAPTNITCP